MYRVEAPLLCAVARDAASTLVRFCVSFFGHPTPAAGNSVFVVDSCQMCVGVFLPSWRTSVTRRTALLYIGSLEQASIVCLLRGSGYVGRKGLLSVGSRLLEYRGRHKSVPGVRERTGGVEFLGRPTHAQISSSVTNETIAMNGRTHAYVGVSFAPRAP